MIRWTKWATATATLLVVPALLLSACGDAASNNGSSKKDGGGGTGAEGAGAPNEGICLLNNCSADEHCFGCPDNRNTCLVEESRCVACMPGSSEGCGEGEECSSFGICIPIGLTCPTDPQGNPEVTCIKNSDCLACSPMHQVCDTDTGKCQACTETNTQHCLSSDICIDSDQDGHAETCSPKCPQSCTVDNDCMSCTGANGPAHACNAHKCAECSPTYPCAAGQECLNGVCTPMCGLPGPQAGTCTTDQDCKFCGDATSASDWNCKKPLNANHGTCAPPAAGCSDLGNGVAVLPAPYNQYTQLCSNDGNCAGVGIQYDVGALIQSLVGGTQLNLGFTQLTIHNATVEYAMPKCASIEITDNLSCGVCVPCKVDSDCAPIAVDPLIQQLFASDPLAQIAGAFLIDMLWGNNPNHDINFFCQEVAFGYGACVPCGNPLQPCGSGGGGTGSGSCDHDVCSTGGPLNTTCGQCAASVCNADSFCCNNAWDSLCVTQANQLCGNICNGGNACAHDACTTGQALNSSCNACVAAICQKDPYCCNTQSGSWDSLCVSYTNPSSPGYVSACANAGCGGGCVHSECQTGGALTSSCSTCAGAVCAADPFCCNTEWDSLCVQGAQQQAACNCN